MKLSHIPKTKPTSTDSVKKAKFDQLARKRKITSIILTMLLNEQEESSREDEVDVLPYAGLWPLLNRLVFVVEFNN